jgi:PhoH-like ATPase
MSGSSKEEIDRGLPLHSLLRYGDNGGENDGEPVTGHVYFQTRHLPNLLPETLPGNTPDNDILGTALALRDEFPEQDVILVSKDINLRIKAAVLGIYAEDYSNDQVLEDVNLLYAGALELPSDFWERHEKKLESWKEEGRTFYRVTGPDIENWFPCQCLYMHGEGAFDAVVRRREGESAIIELVRDFHNQRHAVWGITALNREQNFALNLLMDPEVDFVSLLGTAGTGKTLLALAAGLAQVLDQNRYREIVMTRVTVPLGEDIGFLPGTEEEKMTPWMGALMDNLEVLTQTEGGEWGRAATGDLLRNRIRIHSLNFMRGRTFLNKYIILDEAQNLTAKQMKTLITRAGPGTKIVCLGNVAQIDTPYLTETTSGLTYVVDRFKDWEHSGHIILLRGERSRLADFASAAL